MPEICSDILHRIQVIFHPFRNLCLDSVGRGYRNLQRHLVITFEQGHLLFYIIRMPERFGKDSFPNTFPGGSLVNLIHGNKCVPCEDGLVFVVL